MGIITIGIFWWNEAFAEGFWYGKNICGCSLEKQTYTEHIKHTSHHYRSRMCCLWEFSVIKHIWAIFRFVINYKHWIPRKNISGCFLRQQNIQKRQENIPAINVDPGCPISGGHLDLGISGVWCLVSSVRHPEFSTCHASTSQLEQAVPHPRM